jgi:hypothetical protein
MRRHLARLLERTAIFEVGGDAGAAEGVVADFDSPVTQNRIVFGANFHRRLLARSDEVID